MVNAEDRRLDAAHGPMGIDVAASDIVARPHGGHLLLQVRGSDETVTVRDYFRKNAAGGYIADEVRFADGRLWQMRPASAAPKA